MPLAHVNAYIHASCERVFDVLSDHEGYAALPFVRSARLLRPGLEHRNGRGAVREIRALGLRFAEEITSFERPRGFDYKIIEASLPLRHIFGRVELTPRGEGCEVDWRSEFELPVPVLGAMAGKLLRAQAMEGFTDILLFFKERIESSVRAQVAEEIRG